MLRNCLAPTRECRCTWFATLLLAAILVVAAIPANAQPDLTIVEIDASGVIFDDVTSLAAGQVSAVIENVGSVAAGPFTTSFFEDRNGNGTYEPAVDHALGSVPIPLLATGTPNVVSVLVNTTPLFRDNLIYAFIDSEDAVAESDEGNNVSNSGLACEFAPPPAVFDPELEWSWQSSLVEPTALNVMMTPALIDLTGDGVPEVVFASTASVGGGYVEVGVLRALDGADGSEVFTITAADLRVNTASSVAAGDIDNDGRPEIVACDNSGARLICFEHDGTFKWRSGALEAIYWGAPSIADLNGDGSPEIVVGRQVLDAAGNLLWTGSGGRGAAAGGPLSLVADVNLDGSPDVVAGNTVYNADGTVQRFAGALPDGLNAVANFDDDPYPEIVLVANGQVRLLEHDTSVKWGPVAIPGGGYGGAPTVADYDNDGQPEIGVAGAARYVVYETDGTVKWAAVTQDASSNVTGSSVFDFDGDGSAEVVYRDELFLRVYRGTDGAILYSVPMSSCTWYEYVQVADVDADGNAEIVAVANNSCGYGPQRGVFVYGSATDSWVSTRRIWNQHTYHITNVDDDGGIPVVENNSWRFPLASPYNSYRQNALTGGASRLGAPDLTASLLSATCVDGSHTLTARVGNGGAVIVGAGIPVSFYDSDPASAGVLLGTVPTTHVLAPGAFEDVSLPQPGTLASTVIYAVADDAGGLVGTENECREGNNSTFATLKCPAQGCVPASLVLVDFETTEFDPVALLWKVRVRIRNEGPGIAFGVSAALVEEIDWVTPVVATSSYGDLAPGAEAYGTPFVFDLTGRPGSEGFNVYFTVTWTQEQCGEPGRVVLDPEALVPGEDDASARRAFALHQNTPNPFNPATTISFTLHRSEHVLLQVLDPRGRLVATLVDGPLAAAQHTVRWDGLDLNGRPVVSGAYYYRILTDAASATRKMTLLK